MTTVDGIPCTTLARTIIDVAPILTTAELVRAIDDVQRRNVSMRWLLQRASLLQRPGRSGPAEVIDIVRRRLDGYRVPESWFERLLCQSLRSPILSGLERQFVLCDAGGSFVARFDLGLPWLRLGIEGHSRSFHLGEHAERYDEDRDIRAAKEGWDIQYLGFAATRSPERVLRDIEQIVVRRAEDLDCVTPGGHELTITSAQGLKSRRIAG